MSRTSSFRIPVVVFLCFVPVMTTFAAAPSERYREAAGKIAPRLVRIETIGGHEVVDDTLANEGATTGLLIDDAGHILSSAFNFLHEPSSIIVQLHGGDSPGSGGSARSGSVRKVAKRVATDFNRMVTLLKIEGGPTFSEPLPVVAASEFRIGQSVLAVGRALSVKEPNLAAGILSGTGRIWGKAIQTDAAVSPNNYGGPLTDLDGRVLGLLVPLSMSGESLTAGDETYDGGIGMAVPMDGILAEIVPRLQNGKDLYPGETGFAFPDNGVFIGDATLAGVLKGGPAGNAGLRRGDRITKIDGREIRTALQVVEFFKQRYAGLTVPISFERGGAEQTVTLTTVPAKELPRPEPGHEP